MGQFLERVANPSIDCCRASRSGLGVVVADVPFVEDELYALRRCS